MKKVKNYWMVLCNPLTWYEGTKLYQVNNLLLNLEEEFWKINSRTVYNFVEIGDQGIIKVGIDNRTKNDRYNDETNSIEDKLISGIYATFEIVKNKEENNYRKQCKDSLGNIESFVHIKINKNFFKDEIIKKDKAIEILGENTFHSKSSKKITQKQYEDILLEKIKK
ncbi:hypothetical protein KKA17_05515 [bacterium]|nr:hypothetical protein [bacterium]MBU1883996.1 hypothetical protein [bacterium]